MEKEERRRAGSAATVTVAQGTGQSRESSGPGNHIDPAIRCACDLLARKETTTSAIDARDEDALQPAREKRWCSERARAVTVCSFDRDQLRVCSVMSDASFPDVIELNVGGVFYTSSLSTLIQDEDSLLAAIFTGRHPITQDVKGRYFLDRDGVLFRYVLDFLRDRALVLPEGFRERDRLQKEAIYFHLPLMVEAVLAANGEKRSTGCITVGYRGSFQFGRDGLADVKFRKLSRILVSGRVTLCRDVFGETLNESRDPDHGMTERYTSRFFLKHSFLEQAFDMLMEQGFKLCGSCGSGTAGSTADLKPGVDSEENRWNHYNEFVFVRE